MSPTPISMRLPEIGVKLLDRYLLETFVAKGGMGAIFKAKDTLLSQTVAVKVLHLAAGEDTPVSEALLATLRNEALATMRLSHPNVVRVYNFEVSPPWDILIMEYVAGEDASKFRRRFPKRRVPLDEAIRMGIAVLDGLAHAHELGIVHHDIKPSNILITRAGGVKTCDFGIARLAKASAVASSKLLTGTPAYMCPERIAGKAGDHRSDLYSLGATLYDLLTGKAPYGKKAAKALHGHIAGTVPPSEHLAEPLFKALVRAMAKKPEDRFPSADAMRIGLLAAAGNAIMAPGADDLDGELSIELQTADIGQWIEIAEEKRAEDQQAEPVTDAPATPPRPAPRRRFLPQPRPATPSTPSTSFASCTPSTQSSALPVDGSLTPPRMAPAVDGSRPVARREDAISTAPSASAALASEPPIAPTVVDPVDAPVERPDDMVLLVGGSFESQFDGPSGATMMAPLFIDQYPVTHQQFYEHIGATGQEPLSDWPRGTPPDELLDHPVVGVTVEQARRYAAWKGRRLPRPLEWERAARGLTGRSFPWGGEFSASRCNGPDQGLGRTCPVDQYADGASPEGCCDLIGNVWEWTDGGTAKGENCEDGCSWVYGGSFRHSCVKSDQLVRTAVGTDNSYTYLGFRCVLDGPTPSGDGRRSE